MQLGEWQAKAREENKDALTQALITVLNADRTIKQLREELSVIQQRSDNDRARLQNCQITSIELRNEIAHLRGSIEEVF
jgi:peptidoglycan hydrolase CwlO-like protein